MYAAKEIFYTLQGEGMNTGRPAVFLRFAGCNLWSGREEDRATARCGFCDTDFVDTDGPGGGKFATARRRQKYPIGTHSCLATPSTKNSSGPKKSAIPPPTGGSKNHDT